MSHPMPRRRGESASLPLTVGAMPLVGREKELESLRRALDDAERGTSSTIFLAGEGGIGKTRIAEEVAADARREADSKLIFRSAGDRH